MTEGTSTAYVCAKSVYWVKDLNQVAIVDEQRNKSFILQGVDAAIWNWLSLRYSYKKVVCFVAALLAVSQPEAELILHTALHKWHTQGLLEIDLGNPDG